MRAGWRLGRVKEPGQATQRPGDAIDAMREATIDAPRGRRACLCVDASPFGWAYCVVRHWVARSGLGDSLGAGGVGSVDVVDWVAGYDTSCRARAQEAIGRAEFGQRRRAKRGLVENVPQSALSVQQPGNHGLSAGRSAMNVQSTACGPCDGDEIQSGLALGVGMVMLWIEKARPWPPDRQILGRQAKQAGRVTGKGAGAVACVGAGAQVGYVGEDKSGQVRV